MGSSSGGKRKYVNFRSRQRANMSFFIVVMFFAIFGIIVFTEIFFIDERDRASGVLFRQGSVSYQQKHQDKTDYEDGFQVFENQLPPYPENLTLADGSWQNVNGTRYKFFVFSAYYENRKNLRSVRIIGATKTRGPERVWCRLWYKGSDSNSTMNVSLTVPAKVKVIRENWGLKYSAAFVLCPLKANQSIPLGVSVVSKLNSVPTNLIAVNNNNNDSKAETPDKFGVCVKPLHFEYNKEMQILEFIELNRLMGVSHFTFYNHTLGSQVGCLLNDYVDRGIVTVLPWQLNIASQKEIRTEGLFAALNDCLYRSMYRYSHVLLIDLDEYIIPKYNDTLPQLIEYLGHRMNIQKAGSFSFQNAFFYLQWDDDDSVYDFEDSVSSSLVTLRKTRRKTKLHPHKQRSKYICRPELVVETGNHFVWEFIPGRGTLNVPADAAILHHYRICEFGGDDCIKTASTVDKTAYRYKDSLTEAVKEQYENLKLKCDLTELKSPPTRVFSKIMNILKTGGQIRR